MKIFYCIVSLIFTFSKHSLNAQDIQQSPSSTADYVEMKKRLHEVDVQLKELLNKIDSHQGKKRNDSTKVKGKEGNKNHTHNKVSEIKTSDPLNQVKRDFQKVEAKVSKFITKMESSNTQNSSAHSPLQSLTAPQLDSENEFPLESEIFIPNGDGWNLLILRELALQYSPDVLLKKAELRMDKKDIPIIKFGNMPTVKARISFDDYEKISQFETFSEPEPYSTFSYGVEGRWVLYNGHKVKKQIDIAKNEISRSEWLVHIEEQRVLKNLTNLYFQALSAQTQVLYLPKIEAISEEKLSVYNKKLQSGIVDRMLLNDSVRELESIRAQLLNSIHSLEMAKAELGFLLNVNQSFWSRFEKFVIPEDIELKHQFKPATSSSANLGQTGVDIAKSKYEEIKTGNSPLVELIGSAGHRSRNKLAFNNQGQELTLGLSVTLPISDLYLTRKKLDHARAEINKSELEKVRLISRQRNEFSSEQLRLKQTERNLAFQKEMLILQKEKLADIISGSKRGIYDKSNILMEEEKLQKREMYVELTRINYIKQKYQLDLIN